MTRCAFVSSGYDGHEAGQICGGTRHEHGESILDGNAEHRFQESTEGYRPTHGTIDRAHPPQGGSGVTTLRPRADWPPLDRRVRPEFRASFERISTEVAKLNPTWFPSEVDDLVRRMIAGDGPLRPPS